MAKFSGIIGFGQTVELEPGIHEKVITERTYYGDVLVNSVAIDAANQIHGNSKLGNSFSVLADVYAFENIFAMTYIVWAGVRWTITDVKSQHPRLTIRVGDVYNGPTG